MEMYDEVGVTVRPDWHEPDRIASGVLLRRVDVQECVRALYVVSTRPR